MKSKFGTYLKRGGNSNEIKITYVERGGGKI